MVSAMKDQDPDEFAASRRDLLRTTASALEDTPYGPMIITVTIPAGEAAMDLVAVNPFAYLHTAYKSQNEVFRKMVDSHLAATPSTTSSPWHLILYADEVVPGNQLATVNTRKIWVSYFSFLELGVHLHDERAWCPVIAEPSTRIKKMSGGISQVFGGDHQSVFRRRLGVRLQQRRYGTHRW